VSEHYFSESPKSDLKPREISIRLGGEPRQVITASGVFSPERLDHGTEVLLRTLADQGIISDDATHQPVLDLGCGWGPIALSAALARPERDVWAVEVNPRARELTAENARRLGLSRVRVAAPEEVPGDVRFGLILSNPPIRVGKQVLHEMLSLWLPRLAEGASAYLVVAKHLGADSLQKWISETFTECDVSRLARDKGFHVIAVHRPATS
jgi:16S rRNA G1207 methylase RsmC